MLVDRSKYKSRYVDEPQRTTNADRCVCCGAIIPEGSMVCTNCKLADVYFERSVEDG